MMAASSKGIVVMRPARSSYKWLAADRQVVYEIHRFLPGEAPQVEEVPGKAEPNGAGAPQTGEVAKGACLAPKIQVSSFSFLEVG